MKTISAFVFSALVALVAIVGSIAVLNSVCSVASAPASERTPSRLPIHFEQGTLDTQIERAVFVRDSLDTTLWRTQATPPVQPQATSWRGRFLCDIRITDVLLIGFAAFLLLATVFQGLWMLRSVRASDRTAALVNEGLIAAQRAYVSLREFEVALTRNPLNDEIQTCTIQPVWENSGTTPTRNGRAHVNWKYFDQSVPADFDFADFDELGDRILSYDTYKPLTVGARATALSPVIAMEPAILRQVRDQQGKLMIWGWVEYDEVFGDAKRHRTEFAYLVVVSGSPASHVGFSQYKQHNGVDDDCTKQPTVLARAV